MSWILDKCEELLEWMIERLAAPFVLLVVVLLTLACVLGVYAFVQDSKSPTFSLRKDEWACTESHREQTTTYVKSGSVMVPISSSHKECDQWSKVQ